MQMTDILQCEIIFLWYSFDLQLCQIFEYGILGIIIGSCISVFVKKSIRRATDGIDENLFVQKYRLALPDEKKLTEWLKNEVKIAGDKK